MSTDSAHSPGATSQLPLGVVVNSSAALGRGSRVGRKITQLLAMRGIPFTVISGIDPVECADLIRQNVAQVRGFLLVGGDGLLSIFLQIPEARALPFALIPAGSGNDFAREFGVPRHKPQEALKLALRSQAIPRSVDALVVTLPGGAEHWVGCGLSVGFDAHINRRANAIRLPLGPLRYQLALLAEIIMGRPSAFELTIDGERTRYTGLLATVMNTRTLGGGIPIIPSADPEDGQLDVIAIGRAHRRRLLSVLGLLAQGAHTGLPEVRISRGREILLTAHGETAYADGELVGEGPFAIRVAPGALTVWS